MGFVSLWLSVQLNRFLPRNMLFQDEEWEDEDAANALNMDDIAFLSGKIPAP